VKEEGSKVTIGLTDYAQSQLKDIVYVELPEMGSEFKKGESMGVVESVKTVADIFSPITGKVVETNLTLKDHPQFVNEDPYGKGWIVKMEVPDKKNSKGFYHPRPIKILYQRNCKWKTSLVTSPIRKRIVGRCSTPSREEGGGSLREHPPKYRLLKPLSLPEPLSEPDLIRHIERLQSRFLAVFLVQGLIITSFLLWYLL